MREDLREARAELQSRPGDETLAKQIDALQHLLKHVLAKVERLKRKSVTRT
jgi:hypothetical protein